MARTSYFLAVLWQEQVAFLAVSWQEQVIF
jgi:hypothetical protein